LGFAVRTAWWSWSAERRGSSRWVEFTVDLSGPEVLSLGGRNAQPFAFRTIFSILRYLGWFLKQGEMKVWRMESR
jgi:hypothetical protein